MVSLWTNGGIWNWPGGKKKTVLIGLNEVKHTCVWFYVELIIHGA